MKFHPIADIFPLMEGEPLAALVDDIRKHGLIESIWLYDGQIIDGRNRWRACQKVGIEPRYRTWGGDGSLVAFVVSLNLHRRHLSSSQRAVVALDILPALEAEARERQRGGQGGVLLNQKIDTARPQATQQAAALLNTNRQYVSDAKKIQREAPELLEKVRSGALTIPAAREQISGKVAHVSRSTGNNEWYTPRVYIDAARMVMGVIDLDPASSDAANEVVRAAEYHTAETNGLNQEWHGRVWMNPPYSQPAITHFSVKLQVELKAGRVDEALVLVNNATETGWFQGMLGKATAVCFPSGRVKFIDEQGNPSGAPLQGQAVLYFGNNAEAFGSVFGEFGVILWQNGEK